MLYSFAAAILPLHNRGLYQVKITGTEKQIAFPSAYLLILHGV